tara:strand:- start:206 stop:574 length:369 start_codon:yes stop_codon:yes gene_type:complete
VTDSYNLKAFNKRLEDGDWPTEVVAEAERLIAEASPVDLALLTGSVMLHVVYCLEALRAAKPTPKYSPFAQNFDITARDMGATGEVSDYMVIEILKGIYDTFGEASLVELAGRPESPDTTMH